MRQCISTRLPWQELGLRHASTRHGDRFAIVNDAMALLPMAEFPSPCSGCGTLHSDRRLLALRLQDAPARCTSPCTARVLSAPVRLPSSSQRWPYHGGAREACPPLASRALLWKRSCSSIREGTDVLVEQASMPCCMVRVANGDVPGVVAAATDREGTIYEGGFGKRCWAAAAMTPNTVVWIASMTKAVTGTAAMQLVEQGKLKLDAPTLTARAGSRRRCWRLRRVGAPRPPRQAADHAAPPS